MTEWKVVILKRKWEVFLILPKLDVSFVGNAVAEGKSKEEKKGKTPYFPVVVCCLLSVTGQDSEVYLRLLRAALHIKPIQNHTERMWRWCVAGRFSIFTSSRIEVWCGGPRSSRQQAELTVGKFWGSCCLISGFSLTEDISFSSQISQRRETLSPPRDCLRSSCSANTKRKEDSQSRVDNCGLWTSLGGPQEAWFSLLRYYFSITAAGVGFFLFFCKELSMRTSRCLQKQHRLWLQICWHYKMNITGPILEK